MDLEVKNKVAIVGGASKGLGRACAEVLAEEGVKLAVCSRTQAELERAAQEIRDRTGADVLALAGDLDQHDTIRDLIAAAIGRFGCLDILVNNSGGPPGPGPRAPRKSSGRRRCSGPSCSSRGWRGRPSPI
jgi:3-oxoacyl-[acyl-carrier protein] reductase